MKKYIMIAAISLSAITANATTAQVDINLSTADHDKLSDATLSITNTYKDIDGKISVKVDSAADGKNSKPKIDEAYISKNGFKLGKQGVKFGIASTNFNTLHSSTAKSQSTGGTGLSFEGAKNDFNYTLFASSGYSGIDINRNFQQGAISGNFGFSASRSGDKVAYISATAGKWSIFAQKTNEEIFRNEVVVTSVKTNTKTDTTPTDTTPTDTTPTDTKPDIECILDRTKCKNDGSDTATTIPTDDVPKTEDKEVDCVKVFKDNKWTCIPTIPNNDTNPQKRHDPQALMSASTKSDIFKWTSTTRHIKVKESISDALIEVSYQFRPDLRLSVNNQNMAAIHFVINKNMALNTEFNKNGSSNLNLNIRF